MISIQYIWSRVLKNLKGAAIRNSQVDKTSKVEAGSHFVNSLMDKFSFCGYDCEIVNCKIGKFCSIADNVKIGGARHPIEWVSTSPVFYFGRDSVKKKFSTFDRAKDKKTLIGNDVWIGANVIIIQGIRIGNGSVIGAGSIVTKDVGDYEIVAGNPARFIRKRFSEEIVEELVKLKWWDWPEEILLDMAQYVKEPVDFIESYKSKYGNGMNIRKLQQGGKICSYSFSLAA